MTLHSRFNLTGPITTADAFDLALRGILAAAGEPERYATAIYGGDERRVASRLGQGLPGIVEADRHPDGSPYTWETDNEWLLEDAETDEERQAILDDYADKVSAYPAGDVQIGYDTAYGYTGPNGESCGDLHAEAIRWVEANLPEGVTLSGWYHESMGEWHRGLDDLDTLGDSGSDARNWVFDTVFPAMGIKPATP